MQSLTGILRNSCFQKFVLVLLNPQTAGPVILFSVIFWILYKLHIHNTCRKLSDFEVRLAFKKKNVYLLQWKPFKIVKNGF